MYKVFLIILAMVVNELAASHDQSKIVDNYCFGSENQCSNEFKWMSEMIMGGYVNTENMGQYVPVGLEPSWKLFPNFKPEAFRFINNGKRNFGDCAIIANRVE